MLRPTLLLVAAAAIAACSDNTGPGTLPAPTNLFYVLDPSGDPAAPAGLLLSWDPVSAADLSAYRVYSRASSSDAYDLRGETTSTTFHDVGVPDLDYAVAAVNSDGDEGPLAEIEVDERLRLEAPTDLVTTSLNAAVYLSWTDNPFLSEPDGFKQYRVYSATYSLDENLCDDQWSVEGTTVSPEFIAGALQNGVPRCFAVSAESIEGWESMWSPLRADTPRPDARNVALYPDDVTPAQAGFRFFLDANGDGVASPAELGVISSSSSPAIDFYLHRDAISQDLFLVPKRAGTQVALYGTAPVEDLTSIDVAPEGGYSTNGLQAVPEYGYVFQMDDGDGFFRYGAVRVTHVGQDVVLIDWSYQTDPGNPELDVHGGVPVAETTGIRVRRR